MFRAPIILIADSSASDTELTALLLRRALPRAEILVADDAVSFADALTTQAPDFAIIAPKLSWAASDRVIALLRRHRPTAPVVLFGNELDVLEHSMSPGLAIDGIARKSSAGYLALGSLVTDICVRAGILAAPTTATPVPAPVANLMLPVEALPLATFVVAEDGTVSDCNSECLRLLPGARGTPIGSALESLLGDSNAVTRWRALRNSADDGPIELRFAGGTALLRRVRGTPARERFLGCVIPTPASTVVVVAPASNEPSHQEMRDIALVFSHDLKEPMQQIARLAQRGDEPGDPAAPIRALHQILECARRASGLLDSMLEYLAVSARDSTPVLVDLNQSLEQAQDNLRGVIDEADAQITAGPLPSIIGDEYQMLHLLQNLLSNAIKFRGRDRPEIRIQGDAEGSDWLLTFKDNGIGIAQPYIQRVFEMGQRLHTRDEYPGTGVGLALCKRIAERHGGRIWVTPNAGAGSTFWVRLAQAPSHVTRLA